LKERRFAEELSTGMHWPSIRVLTSRAPLLNDDSATLIASKIVRFPNDRTLSSESPVLVPSAPDDRLSIADWELAVGDR
jgi:hypothetical protein